MSRSRSAMLRLVAKRFEDNAPKELVATLSKFAEELEARKADGRLDGTEELRRIEHQRSLFAMLPDTGAVDRLREAMMQRAYGEARREAGTVKDHAQIGRLAMREEGEDWKAYYAMPDTMKGAIFLGSIKMRFVLVDARKKAFMDLMREAVADLIEEQVGVRPVWGGEKLAPFWEKR